MSRINGKGKDCCENKFANKNDALNNNIGPL